jgi:hypothetical protein
MDRLTPNESRPHHQHHIARGPARNIWSHHRHPSPRRPKGPSGKDARPLPWSRCRSHLQTLKDNSDKVIKCFTNTDFTVTEKTSPTEYTLSSECREYFVKFSTPSDHLGMPSVFCTHFSFPFYFYFFTTPFSFLIFLSTLSTFTSHIKAAVP